MVLDSWKMKKLIEVAVIVFCGYLLIQFMRWVLRISNGAAKFTHFGYSVWGRNIIEIAIVIVLVFWILGALLNKDR